MSNRRVPAPHRSSTTRRVALLVGLALFLAGCASGPSHASVLDRIPPVPAAKGRLYFYRPSAMASALTPPILVNDKSVGNARSKGFLFADLDPGRYTISTSTLLEHRLELELQAGEVKYVRLASSVGLVAGHILPRLTDEATATRELAQMKYIGDPALLTE